MCVYRQNTTLLKCQYEAWKADCSEDSARVFAIYYYIYLKRSLAAYDCDFGEFIRNISNEVNNDK